MKDVQLDVNVDHRPLCIDAEDTRMDFICGILYALTAVSWVELILSGLECCVHVGKP